MIIKIQLIINLTEKSGRKHGEAHKSSAHLIRLVDKLVRNRIYLIKGRGRRRFDEAMEAWFLSRE